jgi:hypothetical protein
VCGECVGAMGGGILVRGGVVVVQQQTQTAFPTAFKNLTFFEFSQIHVFSFTFKSIVNER